MAKGTSKVAYIVAEVLIISLGRSLPYELEFIFTNPELNMELWTVIARIPGFDDD
jgi:hypothetical protein